MFWNELVEKPFEDVSLVEEADEQYHAKSARANRTFCNRVTMTTRCCMTGWTSNKKRTKKKKMMTTKRDDTDI